MSRRWRTEYVLLRAVIRAALGLLAGQPGWTREGLTSTLRVWLAWRRRQWRRLFWWARA